MGWRDGEGSGLGEMLGAVWGVVARGVLPPLILLPILLT